MAALGVLALFLLQLLVISMVMAPREDLGKVLEDFDPLWEDPVKSLEERLVQQHNQLALVESREAANSKIMREKLDQFENILLAFGKKVDKGVDATVTGDDVRFITEELKDLKWRIMDVENREEIKGGGVGEEMMTELARKIAVETVANEMRGHMEAKISDYMQNLVSKNKVQMKTLAQEMVNEKLLEKLEEVRSIEKEDKKEIMNRIERMEDMATLLQNEKANPGVTEALLEDWASEEVGM